jgi:outer membrane lipoprotein-sorting protein
MNWLRAQNSCMNMNTEIFPRPARSRFVQWLIASIMCVLPVHAEPEAESDPAHLLEEIAQNLGKVESVFAHFVQERHLSIFKESLRSEGCLFFQKPGRIRWEITSPYQSILVSDGRGVAQFERVGEQWKKLELGLADAVQNVVSQIGAIMAGRYTARQRDYSVGAVRTADGAVVTLTPQQPAMRRMINAIEIHLSPDFQTRRVVLRELDGDFTDIRFGGQLINLPFHDATFDRNKPADLNLVLPRGKPRENADGEGLHK